MRQGQPYRSELEQPRISRVEDAPRNVDMRHRITEKKNFAAMEINQKGKN
jgi:hypothetical protein